MPGPGGGSHGGGGHRGGGGFSGGGFSGGNSGGGHRGGFSGGPAGGFHGGHGPTPPPPHHGPHFGGGWHRPHFGGGWYRRGYGGGGCSGAFSFIFIIAFLCIFGFFSILPSNEINYSEEQLDSGYIYDENLFQDYADKQYRDVFTNTTAYEDNILLVFLTESENYYDYCYIAWVGDHIDYEIAEMFGNEYTEFGQYVNDIINTSSYKYSLDSNIAAIASSMANEIASKELLSSFSCQENHNQVSSHVINKSGVDITEETVNTSLEAFTEMTGISIIVVVDDIDEVFQSSLQSNSVQSDSQSITSVIEIGHSKILAYGGIIVAVIIVAIAIPICISAAKKRKQKLEDNNAE